MSRYRSLSGTLYVRNVSERARYEDLRRLFSKYGKLVDVTMPLDYYTRMPKGYCFVEYEDPRDAEEALYRLDRQRLFGREIEVEIARGDRKTASEMRTRDRDRRYDYGRDRGRHSTRHEGSRRSRSRSRSEKRHRKASRELSRSRSKSPRSRSVSKERSRSASHHKSPSREKMAYTNGRSVSREKSGSPPSKQRRSPKAPVSRSRSRSTSPVH